MADGGVPARREGDLSVTALYTSQAWVWGGFDGAELLATKDAKTVFGVTNLALALMRLFRPRLPLLRHSLVQRHALIDRLLAESGASQVLEIAAGLSRRGVSVTRDPHVRYVEVDLPAMVAKKRALLERTPEGQGALARENLVFVEGDVRSAPLDRWIAPDRPLFAIAEGLFMYLDAAAQRALWARLASVLRRAPAATFVFDLVPACEQPRPGVIGRALGWLMKRFTRGRTFEVDARTREDILGDLRAAGFAPVETLEPAQRRDGLPHAGARTQVLLFVCRVVPSLHDV